MLPFLSSLLIALSFPTVLFGWKLPNLGFLAWFGLVPLILAVYDASPRQAFVRGFFAAALCYLLSYYWIFVALHDYGELSVLVSLLTLALLAVAMALYIGVACFLARWLAAKYNAPFFILLPAFWTLLEWARNYTPFGGFPWANLAMSQSNYGPLIQFADLTGVYGIGFLIVWVNVWFSEWVRRRQGRPVALFKEKTVVTFLLLALVLGYGLLRSRSVERAVAQTPQLKIGLIQPNIPQEEKWEAAYLPKHRAIFKEAVASLENNVDLIVWPETAWFETLAVEAKKVPPFQLGLTVLREEAKPYTLLGLSFFGFKEKQERYFNSAALLDANGTILGKYHKVHLVPFGEYVPWKKIFHFLAPVAAIGDFERGREVKPLAIGNYQLAPLICFEDIFPELSRKMARQGANLLVNITNDAWYGFTSAAYQHLALAQFRSIETRRAMIRATNTGITAVIDPLGKVANASPWFEQSVLVHRVPLLGQKTTYVKLGDWFVAACFLFVLSQVLRFKKRSGKLGLTNN